jgi:hypothetical protein
MSNPIHSMPTPSGEFATHFGAPPGSSDTAADCKNWEKLCGELLAEREKLRAELTKLHHECKSYKRSLIHLMSKDFDPSFDKELAFAHADDKPTIQEIIAELEQAPGK